MGSKSTNISFTPLKQNKKSFSIKNVIIALVLVIIGIIIGGFLENIRYYSEPPMLPSMNKDKFLRIDKPAIYLYPETRTNINVKLDLKAKLIVSYPEYNSNEGWIVVADPDGSLINLADNKEYSYLFWEAETYNADFDLTKGFVVKGADTVSFLQTVLPQIGLNPVEYNEFIVYWYPKMKDNKYNLIHFAGKEYTDMAKLTISPTPTSVLRVFMVYKPLQEPIVIEPQSFSQFERKGFTVVEWGGLELN